MPVSDCDDVHILCVGRQGFQIVRVRRDHGSPRFSGGDHERIDGGATSGKPAEKRGTTGEGFGDGWRDIASLEEPVLDGVATLQRLVGRLSLGRLVLSSGCRP